MIPIDLRHMRNAQRHRRAAHAEGSEPADILIGILAPDRVQHAESDQVHLTVALQETQLLRKLRPAGQQLIIVHAQHIWRFHPLQGLVQAIAEAAVERQLDHGQRIILQAQRLSAVIRDDHPDAGIKRLQVLIQPLRHLLTLERLVDDGHVLADQIDLLLIWERFACLLPFVIEPAMLQCRDRIKEPGGDRRQRALDQLLHPFWHMSLLTPSTDSNCC